MKLFKTKTRVDVFVTKNLKFRAKIKEPRNPTYEVSVNGKNWKSGKGRKHEDLILIKMGFIVSKLRGELGTAIVLRKKATDEKD